MVKKVGSGKQSPKKLKIAPELSLVQSIMPMSEEDRARLEDDIRKNGIRHPVIVYRGKDNNLLVLAGWHRREIAIKLKIPTIPYDEFEASPLERREFCIKENMSRRHLTSSQKREMIEYHLRFDPKKSNKSIAKETGTTKETVKSARDRLETGGEIRPLKKVIGQDGKTYKKPSPVAAVKPQAPEQKTAHPSVSVPPKDTPGIVTDTKKKDFYDYFKSLVVVTGADNISGTLNYLIGLALESRRENSEKILKNIHEYTVPKDIDTVISLLNERINKMPHLYRERLELGEGHSYERPDPSLLSSYQGEERQNYQVRFFVGVLESRVKQLRNKGHYDASREVVNIIKELNSILGRE